MHIFTIPFSYSLDSRSPDSSSVSSPPSGQRSPPLVPSAAASMTSLPPITTTGVNSPISSIGSPFSVISSSLGSPCLPGTPSVGYGPISSPQVRRHFHVHLLRILDMGPHIQIHQCAIYQSRQFQHILSRPQV